MIFYGAGRSPRPIRCAFTNCRSMLERLQPAAAANSSNSCSVSRSILTCTRTMRSFSSYFCFAKKSPPFHNCTPFYGKSQAFSGKRVYVFLQKPLFLLKSGKFPPGSLPPGGLPPAAASQMPPSRGRGAPPSPSPRRAGIPPPPSPSRPGPFPGACSVLCPLGGRGGGAHSPPALRLGRSAGLPGLAAARGLRWCGVKFSLPTAAANRLAACRLRRRCFAASRLFPSAAFAAGGSLRLRRKRRLRRQSKEGAQQRQRNRTTAPATKSAETARKRKSRGYAATMPRRKNPVPKHTGAAWGDRLRPV